MGNQPLKKYRAGGITATIWKNEAKTDKGETTEYNTVSLERSYKDKKDEWQTTNVMRVTDLPKVEAVCRKAFEYLTIKEE